MRNFSCRSHGILIGAAYSKSMVPRSHDLQMGTEQQGAGCAGNIEKEIVMAAIFKPLTPAVTAKNVEAETKSGRRRRRGGRGGRRGDRTQTD